MNEAITASELYLTDEQGADHGLVTHEQALAMARARGCDLVQNAVFSSPPRCRLAPAGRADAQAARAARIADGGPPKEIRVGTAMGAGDVQTRRRQAAKLLAAGYSVKLSARLAKPERANPTAARALLNELARDLTAEGRVTRKPFGESGALSMLIEPRV